MTNRYFWVIGKIIMYIGVLQGKYLDHNWDTNDVMVHCTLVATPDPHGMVPSFTSNILDGQMDPLSCHYHT